MPTGARCAPSHSPADDKIYANLAFGLQGTGGSSSIANSYEQMRDGRRHRARHAGRRRGGGMGRAGSRDHRREGPHRHAASGKESGFGAFADKAAAQTPPAEPKLKDPKDFVLIGKDLPKLDTLDKTNGKAIFTLDVLADNMLIARGRASRPFRRDGQILRR